MRIRVVSKKDFAAWLEMRLAMWPAHSRAELEAEMIVIFRNIGADRAVFIAEEGGKVYGFIELSIHAAAPGCWSENVGYIEGWYVSPAFRRKHIGRILVERGEIWAAAMGCREMASDTTADYPTSPDAHKALGYEETDIPLHYRKSLL